MCTAALNESQKVCQSKGSPEKVGSVSFGRRLLAACREACTWLLCSGVAKELGLERLVALVGLVTGNTGTGPELTLVVMVEAGTK